jgi:vesicle-associated membrane protein 72
MGDQALMIYSLVARGTTVLAQYASDTGDLGTFASQCLEKLPPADGKHTYDCDHRSLTFLVDDGFAYVVVADEKFGREVAFAFLERVRDDFRRRYREGLDAEFAPRLQEHMAFAASHPDELTKAARIKEQEELIKEVFARGATCRLYHVDESAVGAFEFLRQGRRLRRRMCCARWTPKLLVVAFLIVVACIIYLSILKPTDLAVVSHPTS